tara:strand:+ start:251 stop:511 length:261 start_codon:yes stop_codon:yes gene_type:complete
MYTVGEVVKIRTPVSNLWFFAFLISKDEKNKYTVETFFPVQATTRWTVNEENIKKNETINKKTASTSPDLQKQLLKVIKKVQSNNN